MTNQDLEKKILKMVREDRKKSDEDRDAAEKAFTFFMDNLNQADVTAASKETLAKLLEAKITSSEVSIQATRILMDLLREKNKTRELDEKNGQAIQLDDVDLSDLS